MPVMVSVAGATVMVRPRVVKTRMRAVVVKNRRVREREGGSAGLVEDWEEEEEEEEKEEEEAEAEEEGSAEGGVAEAVEGTEGGAGGECVVVSAIESVAVASLAPACTINPQ